VRRDTGETVNGEKGLGTRLKLVLHGELEAGCGEKGSR
jgi:hypothetical protein